MICDLDGGGGCKDHRPAGDELKPTTLQGSIGQPTPESKSLDAGCSMPDGVVVVPKSLLADPAAFVEAMEEAVGKMVKGGLIDLTIEEWPWPFEWRAPAVVTRHDLEPMAFIGGRSKAPEGSGWYRCSRCHREGVMMFEADGERLVASTGGWAHECADHLCHGAFLPEAGPDGICWQGPVTLKWGSGKGRFVVSCRSGKEGF